MKESIRVSFEEEMKLAKILINDRDYDTAFKHLENAHVIGQLYVVPHTISHLYMLKVGFLRRDLREIWGQLFRIPLGLIGSSIGIVPIGNTGGANVNAFKKMPVSDRIKEILK